MTVQVLLPGVLAELAGGARQLTVGSVATDGGVATVGDLLAELAVRHPALVRRLRDETGAVRRYVNLYVDGDDVRAGQGLATELPDGAVVHVLPSVAGG